MRNNRIEYVYSCTNAMFNFLTDLDFDKLMLELERIEAHAKENIGSKDLTIWFKFGKDDSLANDLKDIRRDLTAPLDHPNRKYMLEQFDKVTKDLNPDNELRVFYS